MFLGFTALYFIHIRGAVVCNLGIAATWTSQRNVPPS